MHELGRLVRNDIGQSTGFQCILCFLIDGGEGIDLSGMRFIDMYV